MKKSLKVLIMFCLIAFMGITVKPVTVQAQTYITSAPKANYSYEAQSDSFSFYADCSWTAEYQGYTGMVTITSSKSGSSGSNTLRFDVNENKTSIDISGAIIIKNSGGTPILGFAITQAKKGNQNPSNPVNNSSIINNGQSGSKQSGITKSSSYITKGEKLTLSCNAQTGSIEFYADCDWVAEFQGYPGMVKLISAASGSRGNRTLNFDVVANSQTCDKEGVILIWDKEKRNVLCHATIKQQGTSHYFKSNCALTESTENSFAWDYSKIELNFESSDIVTATYNGKSITLSSSYVSSTRKKYCGIVDIGINETKDVKRSTLIVTSGGATHTFTICQQRTPTVLEGEITGGYVDWDGGKIKISLTTNDDIYIWLSDWQDRLSTKELRTYSIPDYFIRNGRSVEITEKVQFQTNTGYLHIKSVHGDKEIVLTVKRYHRYDPVDWSKYVSSAFTFNVDTMDVTNNGQTTKYYVANKYKSDRNISENQKISLGNSFLFQSDGSVTINVNAASTDWCILEISNLDSDSKTPQLEVFKTGRHTDSTVTIPIKKGKGEKRKYIMISYTDYVKLKDHLKLNSEYLTTDVGVVPYTINLFNVVYLSENTNIFKADMEYIWLEGNKYTKIDPDKPYVLENDIVLTRIYFNDLKEDWIILEFVNDGEAFDIAEKGKAQIVPGLNVVIGNKQDINPDQEYTRYYFIIAADYFAQFCKDYSERNHYELKLDPTKKLICSKDGIPLNSTRYKKLFTITYNHEEKEQQSISKSGLIFSFD